MTRPYQRGPFAPTYSRAGSEDTCDHALYPHVAYDRAAAGYRATLRCRCHAVTRTSPRLHETYARAEAEARAWLNRR